MSIRLVEAAEVDDRIDDRLTRVLERSRTLGFLGPGPVAAHVEHARALLPHLEALGEGCRALDLGSGGGVPGLVLAVALPSWRWTLLDAMQKRTDAMRQAVDELDLAGRVEVVRQRAEVVGHDPAHRGSYDVVTARSFGPPAATAECGAPLLRPGGLLAVAEPPEADGARGDPEGLRQLGLAPRPVATGRWVILRSERVADGYPRRDGRPAKRPLWS